MNTSNITTMDTTEFYYWLMGFVQGADRFPNSDDWLLILQMLLKTSPDLSMKT